MSQVIAKMSYDAGWGGTHGQMCLNGGAWSTLLTFGEDSARIPAPGPGVFSHLGILGGAGHPAFGITFRVNNVDTDLAVNVTADDTGLVSDTTHTATVVDGDDYSLHLTGFAGGQPGGDIGFVVVFTPVDPTLSIYGLRPIAGSIASGDAWAGGAFGNGLLANYISGTSVTYSISTLAGHMTALRLKSYRGAAGSGNTFTAAVLLNGVLQDGSGGTVDTRVTLDGASTTTAGTFSLPIAIGDKVDLHLAYSGDDLGFALANIGIGCLFQAEAANLSMWCGGTNDAISSTVTSWHWPTNDQNATTEDRAATPVGAIPFTVTGLYVEHSAAPTATSGKSWTDTFRVNSTNTALSVVVADTATSGLMQTDVALDAGDLIDVQVAPTNTPAGAEFHWGLSLEASLPDSGGGGGDSGGGACVTAPPSVACWAGGLPGALGCISTPDGKAGSWGGSYDVTTQQVGLLREGQP